MWGFLTGATGLIGSNLAKYLVERGDDVVALVRPTSDTGFLDSLEVDLVHGDESDSVERLCSAMDGCSHVVHAAALVYSGRGWDAVAAVNVEGTRRVLMAAAASGSRAMRYCCISLNERPACPFLILSVEFSIRETTRGRRESIELIP